MVLSEGNIRELNRTEGATHNETANKAQSDQPLTNLPIFPNK